MIEFNGVNPVRRFPNGEACIDKTLINRSGGPDTITLKYEGDGDLFDLCLLKRSLNGGPIDLRVLYMPYSRMDRYSTHYVFTLKAFADYVNWLDFHAVTVYEPHSDVTAALINNVTTIDLVPRLLLEESDFNPKRDYVLYPDGGAQKRYSHVLNVPHELTTFKHRDFKTGNITHLEVNPKKSLKGKRVFIVDDLCSTGGTLSKAAAALEKLKVDEVNVVVAHFEKAGLDSPLVTNPLVKNIYTTDTILSQEDVADLPKFHLLYEY